MIISTKSQEVPFRFEELFFSRTDERGVILSGNSVFQRVSGYSWDELIDKPHKIIRHPDMPRAVFWLLWSTIKKGESIGAYVKNRAKDGRHYWVFAIITPIDGGYLSVRLKPGSALLSVVEQEYAALRQRELREDMAPADSAALLLARLAELGYPDYQAFMADALSKEVAARDIQLGRSPDSRVKRFGELVTASRSLLEQAETVFSAYSKNEYVSLNFQIQAAQLGTAGAAISQISKNYDLISSEIRQSMDRFMGSAMQVLRTVNTGLFLICVAQIQEEVLQLFQRESAGGETIHAGEMPRLRQQTIACQSKAVDGLQTIDVQASTFRDDCADMKRLAAALGVTRIMGKVESSRQLIARQSLVELIEDLETLQRSIAEGLKEIDKSNQRVHYDTDHLLAESKRLLARAS